MRRSWIKVPDSTPHVVLCVAWRTAKRRAQQRVSALSSKRARSGCRVADPAEDPAADPAAAYTHDRDRNERTLAAPNIQRTRLTSTDMQSKCVGITHGERCSALK